jgi:hypothetical protein
VCRRVLVVFGVVVALVFGLSACAFGGNAVDRQQVNLDNQRKVAVAFLEWQGGVEEIRFTREGANQGLVRHGGSVLLSRSKAKSIK